MMSSPSLFTYIVMSLRHLWCSANLFTFLFVSNLYLDATMHALKSLTQHLKTSFNNWVDL